MRHAIQSFPGLVLDLGKTARLLALPQAIESHPNQTGQ